MRRFRNLFAEEIEVRRGRNVGNSGKVELLLYQNARVGQNLLDEVYGDYWEKDYKFSPNGTVYCGVAITFKDTGRKVWRWDAGAEQNFEKEKSQASDSFKRACVCWGIGRELYSAPRIIVTPDSDYTTYVVREIGYDENDRIKDLIVEDNKGNVVFNFENGQVAKLPEISREEVLKAVCTEYKEAGENKEQLKKFFYYYQERCENFDSWNANLVRKLWAKWKERAK